MDSSCPLIIFTFLRWNFIASCTLCQSWQKGGENVVFFFLRFYMLAGEIRAFVRGVVFHLVRGSVYLLVVLGASFSFMYTGLVTMFTYVVLIFDIYLYANVCLLHLPLHVLFIFSLYTHVSYILYVIYYFCFTQRCIDEFCLKCFRNIGC